MRWLDAVGTNAPDDYIVAVGLGHVPGWRTLRVAGFNPSTVVGANNSIWPGGGTRVLPLAAAQASVVSTDANDTALGTGARRVRVEGLLADYSEKIDVVNLNGTTPVLTPSAFLRINRVIVDLVGTVAGSNLGAITASVGGNVQAHVPIGYGETAQMMYCVPAGYIVAINRYMILPVTTLGGPTATLTVRAQVRLFNASSVGSYEAWRTTNVLSAGGESVNVSGVVVAPEKTDIRAIIESSNAAGIVSGMFGGFLIKTGFN